jgi:branched-chain amino acid transport system substrate-binding protein
MTSSQVARRTLVVRGAAMAAALAAPNIASSAEPMVIGMSLPQRGSQARQAEATRQGVDACFEQTNRSGGIGGVPIRLVTVDNGYEVEKTIESVKAFAAQRAVAMTSLMGGPLINAAIPVARDAQLPIIGVIHGGDSFRAPGTEIVTHVRAAFSSELAAIARVFVTVGRRRFAVLHATDPSGKAFLNQFGAALKRHDLQIVAAVPYERDTKDFGPMAQAIGASGADVVVVGGVTGPGIALIRAMSAASVRTQIACLSTVDDRAVWEELEDRARGVAFSSVVPSPQDGLLPIVRDYQSAMAARKYGETSLASLEGYVNGRLCVEALRRTGTQLDRLSLQRTLKSLSAVPMGGLTFAAAGAPAGNGINVADVFMLTTGGRLLR